MKNYLFNFQPHKRGLRAILGDLETAIMEVMWREGSFTVREMHGKLAKDRKIAYTTVMTVMSRLAEKGLLVKEKEGNAFRYGPAVSEKDFRQSTLKKILASLVGDFGTPVLSQFVDIVDRESPEKMEELARLIQKKREDEHE